MLSDEAIIALVALLLMCAPAALIIYRRIQRRVRRSADVELVPRDMPPPIYQPPHEFPTGGAFLRPFHARPDTPPHGQPHYHHYHPDYQQERRPPHVWFQSVTARNYYEAEEGLLRAQSQHPPQLLRMAGFVEFEFGAT